MKKFMSFSNYTFNIYEIGYINEDLMNNAIVVVLSNRDILRLDYEDRASADKDFKLLSQELTMLEE